MNQPDSDSIDKMRTAAINGSFDVCDVQALPMDQFEKWFTEARKSCPADWFEVNGATLATSSPSGEVSARVILVKGLEPEGVVFYTNYDSKKGKQLADNPQAAIVFWWPFQQRQVRMTGRVSKTSTERSQNYFHSRPRGSQLGAASSPQSQVVPNREALETGAEKLQLQIGDREIPCPKNWGGFLLSLDQVEFWQGRADRLHDRVQYRLQDNGSWTIERLAP